MGSTEQSLTKIANSQKRQEELLEQLVDAQRRQADALEAIAERGGASRPGGEA